MKREVPQYRAYPVFRFAVAAAGAVGVLALLHAYMWSGLWGSSWLRSVYSWKDPQTKKTMAILINIFIPSIVGGAILGWRKFQARSSTEWSFILGLGLAINVGRVAIIALLGTIPPDVPSVSGMSPFLYWFWHGLLSCGAIAVAFFGGKQKWDRFYK